MGKKTEELRRVVRKLSERYGANDESVQRLLSELSALEMLEANRRERRSYKPQQFKFQTPAKQLFFAARDDLPH